MLLSCSAPPLVQTKSDHDVAANRTQDNLDKQRKHIEDSVKKMTKAASGKGGDQKKSGQARRRSLSLLPAMQQFFARTHNTRRPRLSEAKWLLTRDR